MQMQTVEVGPDSGGVPSGNALIDLALRAMGDKLTDRAKKALYTYLVLSASYKVGKQLWDRGRREMTYTITVGGTDGVYSYIHDWLLEQLPPRARRSLLVESRRESVNADGTVVQRDQGRLTDSTNAEEDAPSPVGRARRPAKGILKLRYDGTRAQTVRIEGHRVTVRVEKPHWSQLSERATEKDMRFLSQFEHVEFTCLGAAARDAVQRLLGELADKRYSEERRPELWITDGWGNWEKHDDLPPRPLSTVVLPEWQIDDLLTDLQMFFDSEGDYARLGTPWHRGYLLHGPPGTGKTSLARAVAHHFGMDVYWVPLKDLRDDVLLTNLMSRVPARSMVLLEDLETLPQATSAADEQHREFGVSQSGLRNTLDGMATPHGLVKVVTSNEKDKIDPILLRRGRIDKQYDVSYCGELELLGLFRMVYGDLVARESQLPVVDEDTKLTASDVVEVLKTHLDDPAGAADTVAALVKVAPEDRADALQAEG